MNKGDEHVGTKSKFLSTAEEMKDNLGPALCLAKWKQVSLHLTTGLNNSCYHPPLHEIDAAVLKDNPSALHNTAYKKEQRKIMLKQEKPAECSYCWNIEAHGQLSDRHYRSGEPWAAEHFDTINSCTGNEDEVVPSYVEVNFNHACNLACSYCSPQFSSTWQAEVDKYGGYPTSTIHNDPSHFSGRNRPIPASQHNPYVDAFWEWWPTLYPKLKHFRMTGGEPLMDKNTFRMFDYVKEHPKLDEFIYSLVKEQYIENALNPYLDKSKSELRTALLKLSHNDNLEDWSKNDFKHYLENEFDPYGIDPSYIDEYLNADELRYKLLRADLIKEHKINNIYTHKHNKMNPNKLRRIIRESVNDFIREIDEAGDTAAMEAKIAKGEEAIALREKKIEMSESLEEMKDLVDSTKSN